MQPRLGSSGSWQEEARTRYDLVSDEVQEAAQLIDDRQEDINSAEHELAALRESIHCQVLVNAVVL